METRQPGGATGHEALEHDGEGHVGDKQGDTHQCVANIRIFKYIQLFINKYIHSPKYLWIFFSANIFRYSFKTFISS